MLKEKMEAAAWSLLLVGLAYLAYSAFAPFFCHLFGEV